MKTHAQPCWTFNQGIDPKTYEKKKKHCYRNNAFNFLRMLTYWVLLGTLISDLWN